MGNPLFISPPCPWATLPIPSPSFPTNILSNELGGLVRSLTPHCLLWFLSQVCSEVGELSPVLCHTCESSKVNLGEGYEAPGPGSGEHLRVQTKSGFLTPAAACRPRVPRVLLSVCVSVCGKGVRKWGKRTLPKWLRATVKGVMSCLALRAYLSPSG